MNEGAEYEESEKRGFFQRYGFALGVLGIAAVVGIIFAGQSLGGHHKSSHKAPEVTMVRINPQALPPPPPPPPPPQTIEQKMVEQAPVDDTEQKPDEQPAPAQADLGTGIQGNGPPDAFGLGGAGGGRIGGGKARSSGSRWGWYAAQVQRAIGDAVQRNAGTRNADFRVDVRIWPDITGRVTRAQLAGTTGDRAVDAALKNEVLVGLRLQEPPPRDLPLPIVLRVTARRPN